MPEPSHLGNRTFDQFVASLHELPEVQAELVKGGSDMEVDRGYDMQLDLLVAGKPVTLLVEFKKNVFPRDVRQMHWKFTDLMQTWSRSHDTDAQPMLVAESISPGAKEILKAERWGYYDSGGSMLLPTPGAFIYVEKPPPKSVARSVRSLFSGRSAQVLHALLVNRDGWFGVTGMAARAQVSASTAAQVLAELDRHEWTESRGQGPAKERRLREPSALLDAWATEIRSMPPPTLQRYFVPGIKSDLLPEKASQIFEAHDVLHAVTHEAAAQRYAPFLSSVSQVRCRVLPDEKLRDALEELNARPVSEGANLALIEAKDQGELQFLEERVGVWLASPVQVYLDLMRSEGRAKEAAEHLRKETIGF